MISPQLIKMRPIQRRAPTRLRIRLLDLENEVADVENAGSQRVGPLPHLEIVEHLQAGETDVDAVQNVDHVEQKQKGKQAPGDFAQHNSLQGVLHTLPFPSEVCRRFGDRIATLKPDDWRLFDMLGNANEWCSPFNGADPNGHPMTGPFDAGNSAMMRGGCYPQTAQHLRSAMRNAPLMGARDYGIGFRPIRTCVLGDLAKSIKLGDKDSVALGACWMEPMDSGPPTSNIPRARSSKRCSKPKRTLSASLSRPTGIGW